MHTHQVTTFLTVKSVDFFKAVMLDLWEMRNSKNCLSFICPQRSFWTFCFVTTSLTSNTLLGSKTALCYISHHHELGFVEGTQAKRFGVLGEPVPVANSVITVASCCSCSPPAAECALVENYQFSYAVLGKHLGKGWIVCCTTNKRLLYWANGLFYPSWNRLYPFTAYR